LTHTHILEHQSKWRSQHNLAAFAAYNKPTSSINSVVASRSQNSIALGTGKLDLWWESAESPVLGYNMFNMFIQKKLWGAEANEDGLKMFEDSHIEAISWDILYSTKQSRIGFGVGPDRTKCYCEEPLAWHSFPLTKFPSCGTAEVLHKLLSNPWVRKTELKYVSTLR